MNEEPLMSIAAVGDVCLGDHYFSIGHGTASTVSQRKSLGIDAELTHIFNNADVAFCNMECPLSHISCRNSKLEKAVFRGHPNFARLISKAGFSVVSVANNHICQHGLNAFDDTVTVLESQSIKAIGLANLASIGKYSTIPYFATIRGVSIGFLSYSLVPERYIPTQNKYASSTKQQILQDVKELAQNVDIVIVSIHGGEEAVLLPPPHIISCFRDIIDAGATIVLGHHTHVLQPLEKWGKGLIIYSLGDFIFDLFWNNLLVESAVVLIDILPNKNFVYKIIPVVMHPDYKITLLHGLGKTKFFERVDKASLLIRELDKFTYEKLFLQHVEAMGRGQVLLKWKYFIRNFTKGNMLLKSQFVYKKIKKLSFHPMAIRRAT